MKLTIIFLAISLYVAFGELTYQWTKNHVEYGKDKNAHYADLFLCPIAWIIGLTITILDKFKK